MLRQLKDVFDNRVITKTIERVRERLTSVLENDAEYFMTTVYFKPKKYKDGQDIFRPIHTAKLIDQIAITAMLQVLVYEVNESSELVPSELSRLIPSNFFGNRISYSGKKLFNPWQTQYQRYTARANDILYNAGKTHQYSYEVTLDLENFFPSIHPQMLYNYIMKKIPLSWKDDKTISTMLRKLLIFRLCSLDDTEWKWYLLPSDGGNTAVCSYVKGLPQGLPHTYFFANLLMVMISEEYKKVFPGEAVFYVDDSVIFTSGESDGLNQERFFALVQELNSHIQQSEQKILCASEEASILPPDFGYEPKCFGIHVHEPDLQAGSDSKSYFYTISDASENSGELYLHGLSREASNISFDLNTALSDAEAEMMKSRVEAISNLINCEIEQVKDDPKQRVYLAKLIRYKKFFAYRESVLRYRIHGNLSSLKKQLLNDITLREEKEKKEFYEKYTDDILASAIQFVLKRCADEHEDAQEIRIAVYNLAKFLYGDSTQHAYILIACRSCFDSLGTYSAADLYQTVSSIVQRHYYGLRWHTQEKRWEEFSKIGRQKPKSLFKTLGLSWLYDLAVGISSNIEEFTRMLLNGIFSYLFEFTIEDRLIFAKHSKEPIQYAEIRILTALRNQDFNCKKFWYDYNEYTQDAYMCAIDYSLLQVMETFRTFVCNPKRIDQLIQIHKYCCDTWKNGSKYLHFYTLHNQEHAVTLIGLCTRWIHAVSLFQPKRDDYFVLFAACYLHDISMVTLPAPEQFYATKDIVADEIFTALSDKLNSTSKMPAAKEALYEAYQRIDGFFEQKVRGSHAADSANEIRKFDELSFLESTMRETIARVSEAHGFAAEDVYAEKAAKKGALIDEKLIKILLRLSDLLDMSRYRISKVVLDHNLTSLNETSRFHWISHLITDQCDINATCEATPGVRRKKKLPKPIKEKLVLTVDVLMSQTTKRKPIYCEHISCIELKGKSGKQVWVNIRCDPGKRCDGSKCNFLCKWFMRKNNYLVEELASLKGYLARIQVGLFSTDIEIQIRAIENTSLPGKVFDYLGEYVEKGSK